MFGPKRKSFSDKKHFVVPTDRTPRKVYYQPKGGASRYTGKRQFKDGSIRKPKKGWF